MKNILGKTEVIANIAVITLAIILSGVLIKHYFVKTPPTTPTNTLKIGMPFKVNGIEGTKQERVLVIVLSPNDVVA